MTEYKISWTQSASITGAAITLSFILFLLIEVLWADIMKDYIIPNVKTGEQFHIIFIILMIGLFISIGINSMLYIILIKNDYDTLFVILFVALVLTLVTIFFISYIFVYQKYSYLFIDYSIMDQLFLMPSFVIFFAVYVLESPVLLWDIISIIFNIYMFLLMKAFVHVKYRPKTKVKEIYKRVI